MTILTKKLTPALNAAHCRHNLSLSVLMKEADREKCDKQYCIRGDRCLEEKTQLDVSYERLCREPEKHSTPDPTLKCGLWREKPEFIWKPLKVEWMLENPPVCNKTFLTVSTFCRFMIKEQEKS